MGTGARRNRKAHMARLVDTTLRTVLTAAFGLVTRRARRRRGVHAVALTPERRIVLVRLRYAPGWRLPGGGLDAGEDLERAALRELREEIGMITHGPVRHGLGDPDPVLIVEDVRYKAPGTVAATPPGARYRQGRRPRRPHSGRRASFRLAGRSMLIGQPFGRPSSHRANSANACGEILVPVELPRDRRIRGSRDADS